MANIRDFKNKNTVFTGTDSIVVPNGSTAERLGTELGQLRYNTDTGFPEFYTSTGWTSLDAPPTVTSISPESAPTPGTAVTVTGTNFRNGATIRLIGTNGLSYTPDSIVFISATSMSFQTPVSSPLSEEFEPYDVSVLNPSGLGGALEDILDVGRSPTWSTSSGSLATIYDSARSSYPPITVSASDPDGGTITYSIISGALPTGMSFNTSTGAITGTPNAVGSNTTFNFTIRAVDNPGGNTTDRAFSITVQAPAVQSFTSGSGTWSVPVGVSNIQVLVVAAGAPGGNGNANEGGGGGGAGGMVEAPSFPVTPGGTVSYSVGSGGTSPTSPGGAPPTGNNGGPSTFGGITANGGGAGGYGYFGYDGGSGGGGSGFGQDWPAGNANQSPSGGGTGYGNPGGTGRWVGPPSNTGAGGGGGGAGGAGQAGPQGPTNDYQPGGAAGPGRSNSITGSSITYATGGRGGYGRARSGDGFGSPTGATSGGANRGEGGSGGNAPGTPGAGGPGVVIIRY